jgi:transcriptional regulator with XRE-family HTH domain
MPTETDRRLAGVMLRATREMAGVSRDVMAEECGVSPGTISNWESGRSIPARAHLKVWSELCAVPLADLYRIIGLSDAPISLPHYWRSRGPIPAPESADTSMDAGGDTSRADGDNAPPTGHQGTRAPGSRYPRSPSVVGRTQALAATG